MSLDTQRKGQIGVNAVERIVLTEWHSRWQAIDCANDDGVDGLIFIESGGQATGQIVFAQIKYRKNQKPNKNGMLAVSISEKRLRANRERWRRIVGAMILICVAPNGSDLHWVDLKAGAIKGTQIYVPTSNKFDRAALTTIGALCGPLHRDILLPHITTSTEDFEYLKEKGTLHGLARHKYRQLNCAQLSFLQSGSAVRFTREGWRHITRKTRPRLVQLQSFQLLGAIAPILHQTAEADLVIVQRRREATEFAVVRTTVSFPFRQTAVVVLVFRRRRSPNGVASYSFHTIYEPRRRSTILGAKRSGLASQTATSPTNHKGVNH